MGYSYARKIVLIYKEMGYLYKETGFSYKGLNYLYESFIQGTELFIRIIHTRKGVIHIQGNEFFIYKEMSCSYIQENELFIWIFHTRNGFLIPGNKFFIQESDFLQK